MQEIRNSSQLEEAAQEIADKYDFSYDDAISALSRSYKYYLNGRNFYV